MRTSDKILLSDSPQRSILKIAPWLTLTFPSLSANFAAQNQQITHMNQRKERLNEAVKALGMTLNAFATQSGIDPTNLCKMMHGDFPITDDTLQKIASAFPRLNLEWLLTGNGDIMAEQAHTEPDKGEGKEQTYMSGNLQRLLNDFISVQDEQSQLLDKAINNMHQAMEQTGKAIDNTNRILVELAEQRKQTDRIIAILMNAGLN